MTETLLYCLSQIGRGDPERWKAEAVYQGGFSLPDRFKPYTRCSYGVRGVELVKGGQKTLFKASVCDAAIKPKKKVEPQKPKKEVTPQLMLEL